MVSWSMPKVSLKYISLNVDTTVTKKKKSKDSHDGAHKDLLVWATTTQSRKSCGKYLQLREDNSPLFKTFLKMTRIELQQKLCNIQSVIDKVNHALNTTTIPPYVYIDYIKKELGIDLDDQRFNVDKEWSLSTFFETRPKQKQTVCIQTQPKHPTDPQRRTNHKSVQQISTTTTVVVLL